MKMTLSDYEMMSAACSLLEMVQEGMVKIEVNECFKGVIHSADYNLRGDQKLRLHIIRKELNERIDSIRELEEL